MTEADGQIIKGGIEGAVTEADRKVDRSLISMQQSQDNGVAENWWKCWGLSNCGLLLGYFH